MIEMVIQFGIFKNSESSDLRSKRNLGHLLIYTESDWVYSQFNTDTFPIFAT